MIEAPIISAQGFGSKWKTLANKDTQTQTQQALLARTPGRLYCLNNYFTCCTHCGRYTTHTGNILTHTLRVDYTSIPVIPNNSTLPPENNTTEEHESVCV